MLNIRNNTNRTVCGIYVRFIAHVVNLAVKVCLPEVHEQINQTKSLLSSMRSSVKRHGVCKATQRQLGLIVAMTSLGVQNQWSSTSKMTKNAYIARVIPNPITGKSMTFGTYQFKRGTGSSFNYLQVLRVCRIIE